jgi:putative NADH-flavin reductase
MLSKEVTAIVRNETKLQAIQHNKLKIIKCNLLDVSQLKTHFAGHDCILSALGSPGLTLWKPTFALDSMRLIVEAMRATGLKRIILVSSQYTKRKVFEKLTLASDKSNHGFNG